MDRGITNILAVMVIVGTTVVVGTPCGAIAQEQGGKIDLLQGPGSDSFPRKVFGAIDTNGDGKVVKGEFAIHKMDAFYLRDADKNLFLTRAEFDVLSPTVFNTIDLDGDGKISTYEFNQMEFLKFEQIDGDGDGGISFDEFTKFRERVLN